MGTDRHESRDRVPSRAESELRAADGREARRERVANWLVVGVPVAGLLAFLAWLIVALGGELS